ncbi:Alpha-mannosidase 2x, partial [Blattella germanica]
LGQDLRELLPLPDPQHPCLLYTSVPHSHNDPGWVKTYESYYHYQTRNILNNMVDKLQNFKNMTFIWTEVSFFSQWWESAHPTKRRVVKQLLDEGRLEIMTGGWVMTDEATTHIYGMLDQLIEGHQWVKNNLGLTPKSGWSIDPFGHGSTVPYLLKTSGVTGTVIQRIHYAWKQWLAERQMGDFLWRQNWDPDGRTDLLTHNQPFDIYSIKHSCGPHPQVCLNFDFRKIPGEYTEYSLRAVPIDQYNVKQKAELLLEQYGRTGSLFPHNVVLMPLGDDFRFDHDVEWNQQYNNYKMLFDYINQNQDKYHAEVRFGTPSDYFAAVRERTQSFQSLRGDFFVYSDIFAEGRPAYWSGYFTTRPYWKILDRELESNLRSAEILYTVALNRARQHGFNKTIQLLERDYERITKARQSLALFQHHDAITGTSKSFVMHDYALKMFEGIQDTVFIQQRCAQTLLARDKAGLARGDPGKTFPNKPGQAFVNLLLPDMDRESYEKLPQKVPLVVPRNEPRRIAANDNTREDADKSDHVLQMARDVFEVMFVADLPPLSLVTYVVEREKNLQARSVVYCAACGKNVDDPSYVPPFEVKGMQTGDIQLENHRMKLLFDGRSGFLKAVTRKATGHTTQCGLQFAAYPSAQFHSGAYLFMPDPNSRELEKDVLDNQHGLQIVITSGPIASELSVIYHPILAHSMQKRVKVERIGIEGNYFPITSMAYIQDSSRRLSLLVNHAQGAASWQPGWLEVMLDRRTLYDDSRGMGEGIVDNKRMLTKFWLLLEEVKSQDAPPNVESFSRPSLFAHHLSNGLMYPANLFVVEGVTETDKDRGPVLNKKVSLLTRPFPCDVHLLNLRTLSDANYMQFPSTSALMVIHRQGYACDVGAEISIPQCSLEASDSAFHKRTLFNDLNVGSVALTTLTGLNQIQKYPNLDDVAISPMELLSLNMTFVL